MSQTKAILVTGASGFTGRHLCARLRERNDCSVIQAARCREENSLACDFTNMAAVKELIGTVQPHAVYHCVGSFSNCWDADISANVLSTTNLLTALEQSRSSARTLLFGSAAEYGVFKIGPIPEDSPLEPASVYGTTKVMQTVAMEYFVKQRRLDVVMARPFNLFGDGISPLLFPGAVAQKIRNVQCGLSDKVEIKSLGASRDYIPISEAVSAYMKIMDAGISGEIYNVGRGSPTPISALLEDMLDAASLTKGDVVVAGQDVEVQGPVSYACLKKFLALSAS